MTVRPGSEMGARLTQGKLPSPPDPAPDGPAEQDNQRRDVGCAGNRDPPSRQAEATSSNVVSRTAVKPERPRLDHTDLQQPGAGPRILREARPDVLLTGGLDHMQGLLAVPDWATQDQEAVVDQPVHEGRVLVPPVLLPDGPRRIPAGAVYQPDREVCHGRTVLAATDSHSAARGGVGRYVGKSVRASS